MKTLLGHAWRALALIVLSGATYLLMFLFHRYGQLSFYSVQEHALLAIYGACSYAATAIALRRRNPPGVVAPRRYAWTFLASSAWFIVLSTAVFVGMKLITADRIVVAGLLLNVPMTLLMFHFVIAGTLLGWDYHRQRNQAEMARLTAERELATARLRLLQQQIDPHFLFNSLNALNALIGRDAAAAQDYLQRLSAFYRHLVRHRDAEWVRLSEESALLETYMALLALRFGDAYRLQLRVGPAGHFWIVPGALVELVGNAIKHNRGSASDPLVIEVQGDEAGVRVVNPKRLRASDGLASGAGLRNLQARYRLVAGIEMTIRDLPDRFEVELPRIVEVAP